MDNILGLINVKYLLAIVKALPEELASELAGFGVRNANVADADFPAYEPV